MKKELVVFSLLLLFSLTFVLAQNTECASGDESCKISLAKSCLNDKIDNKECSGLSSDEKVFSLLAVGKCLSQVKDDSKFMDDVKFTSQAILSGSAGSDAKDWLFEQNKTATGLNWYLEIESTKPTKCDVDYSNSNEVAFGEDRKIESLTGGSCLRPSQSGYWLEVSPDCYDQNFTVSCNESFLTTLLYQKQGDDTIYVSDATHSSSAEGTTEEKVDSLCFTNDNSCNYEATLWGATALNFLGKDVKPYLSYLTALKDDNENLLPESFLYYLTGNSDFRNELLSGQVNSKWWLSLNDKFYGTGLALFALQFENPVQKTDTKDWLFDESQGSDGCWDNGNIKSTAFIVYSLNPTSQSSETSSGGIDCVAAGYSCTSQINCAGNVLSGYSCSGAFVCCTQKATPTCSAQGGEICNSNQNCVGVGSFKSDASDTNPGQTCCVQGTCQEPQTSLSECESSGGNCRVNSCLSGEDQTALSCDFSTDVCCVAKPPSTTNYLWIWILLILIVLVVLAIFFREKLRPYYMRIKSKFKKKGGSDENSSGEHRPPRYPPSSPLGFMRPPTQRRQIPPQYRRRQQGFVPKAKEEMDDVLKKLKDMSK